MKKYHIKNVILGAAIIVAVAAPALGIAEVNPFEILEDKGNVFVDFLFGAGAKIVASVLFAVTIYRVLVTKKMDWNEALWWIVGSALLGMGGDVIDFLFNVSS